jgi:hypothetical protein
VIMYFLHNLRFLHIDTQCYAHVLKGNWFPFIVGIYGRFSAEATEVTTRLLFKISLIIYGYENLLLESRG